MVAISEKYIAERFSHDGAIVVPAVYDRKELAEVRERISELEETVVREKLGPPDNTWRKDKLWTIYALQDRIGSSYRALLGHPELLKIVESILGPGFSPMMRNAVTVKRDGDGAPVSWHRDWTEIPKGMDEEAFYSRNHMIAITLPLDPYTIENCFWAFPGSHRVSSEKASQLAVGKRDPFITDGAMSLVAYPGDVIIHNYWVMHGSAGVQPGQIGRRGLVLAFWSKELSDFTQKRFPEIDLKNEDRHRVLATCIAIRQKSPYNKSCAPYEMTPKVEPFPEDASLRLPYWHGSYYARPAEEILREVVEQ